jgi:hypothetical protein
MAMTASPATAVRLTVRFWFVSVATRIDGISAVTSVWT